MRRVIKFRFWDMDLKKMCFRNPATMDFSHPKIIPMQYTGLKDKSGKDIYDGDIVQFGDSKAKIEWGNSDLCFIFWYEKHQEWYGITFLKGYKDFEVIGNIHENPELL